MSARSALIAAVLLAGGCHAAAPKFAPFLEAPVAVALEADAPTVAVQPFALSAVPVALYGDAERLWLATNSGVLVWQDGTLKMAHVLALENEPQQTGPATVLGQRDGGLIALTQAGIYTDQGPDLVRSPLTDTLAGKHLRAIAATGAGVDEQTWLLAEEGLFLAQNHQLNQVTLPNQWSLPTALTPLHDSDGKNSGAALAVPGQGLCVLDTSWNAQCLPAQSVALAIAGTRTGALVDGDVLVHADDTWNRWHAKMQATDLQGKSDGSLLLRLGQNLLQFDGESWQGLVQLPAEVTTALLAQGPDGATFVTTDRQLRRFDTGRPVLFGDIAPILQQRCTACHGPGQTAPKHDWTDLPTVRALADAILTRVGTGQMPPPPQKPLSQLEIHLFARWRSSGMQP